MGRKSHTSEESGISIIDLLSSQGTKRVANQATPCYLYTVLSCIVFDDRLVSFGKGALPCWVDGVFCLLAGCLVLSCCALAFWFCLTSWLVISFFLTKREKKGLRPCNLMYIESVLLSLPSSFLIPPSFPYKFAFPLFLLLPSPPTQIFHLFFPLYI